MRSLTDTAQRTLDALPPYLYESVDVRGVLTALASEVDLLDKVLNAMVGTEDVSGEIFPLHSTSTGTIKFLPAWESLLNIPVDPTKSDNLRQANIQATLLALKNADSADVWKKSLDVLIGSGTAWSYTISQNALTLYLPFGVSLTGPQTPAATAGTGSGSTLTAGTYYYAVSAYNAYGETAINAISSPVTATAGQQVNLTWTAPANGTATGYYIYRGSSAATMKRLVSTTPSAITTLSFSDKGYVNTGPIAPSASSTTPSQVREILRLARRITPAHITITQGYSSGFILDVSTLGATL
jgi:hypothetical protein